MTIRIRSLLRTCSATFAFVLIIAFGSVARGEFVYTTNSDAITITGYNGGGGPVSIPSVIDGFPVTAIARRAFSSKSTITSVVVPASVVSIGNEAFANCTAMTDVALPEGILTIAFGLFSNCGSLQNIVLPTSVTNIGDYAFTYCGLTNLNLPRQLVSIGNVAFANCDSLIRVTFPSSVSKIGTYAFSACTQLRGAYFNGDAPQIGFDAFVNDDQLTIYYTENGAGWSSRVGGRPATLWNPRIVTNDGKLGVAQDQFGFTVVGSEGVVVIVEATRDLGKPVWVSIETNTLSGSGWYFKTSQSADPTLFFRLRSP